MKIEIFNYYSKNDLNSPVEIYGDVPFLLDRENGELNIDFNNQIKKIKYWSWDDRERGIIKIYKEMYRKEND